MYNAAMTDKRKSSRRQFLKGKSAIDALADVSRVARDSDLPETPAPVTRSYLAQVARTAMACEFQVYLNAGEHRGGIEAAVSALDLVESLESQMTVYRDSSEISDINRTAFEEDVPVEPRLFELLRQALDISHQTGGAFDITSGPLSRVWGFHRREGRVPSAEDLEPALGCVGSRWVSLDERHATIRFLAPGVELNLGGIGKGYALDRCRELLELKGVSDFLMHGGHSSVVAVGDRSQASGDEPGWTVAVRHPLRTEQRLLEVKLRNEALGTSGTAKQFFYHRGKRFGHILDPRTGFPADGVLSATVLAKDATTADALATSFYVMGREETERYCSDHGDISVLLVCVGQKSGSTEIVTINIADSQWRAAD